MLKLFKASLGTENKIKKSRLYILQLIQLSQLFLFSLYQELIFQLRYINPTFLFRISSWNFVKYCFVPVETYSFKWPSIFIQAFNRTVWNPGRERKVSIREIKKGWAHTACTQSWQRLLLPQNQSPWKKSAPQFIPQVFTASSLILIIPEFGGFVLFPPFFLEKHSFFKKKNWLRKLS